MESTPTAKASAYLDHYSGALVPHSLYEREVEQLMGRGVPLNVTVTSFSLSTDSRGAVLRTKTINSLKHRGLIFRFYDDHIPRPFSRLEKLEATYLDPAFKKYEILEAPGDDILVVLDTCDDWPIDFGYDWMGKLMITVTWKLPSPAEG